MDRFEQLRAFLAVVDSGGFSAAAERLGIAKSAVSRRIGELEDRLGARLFNRTTRRVSLTDSGRSFHGRVAALVTELEEAEHEVSHAHGALRGALRVAAPLSFGLKYLAPALNEFLSLHPAVELDLDLNDRQVDLVHEGFDMAVRIGRLADSSLIARRLSPVRRILCASPGYLRIHGTPERPTDLSAHQGLHYSNVSRRHGWLLLDRSGDEWLPDIPIRYQANNGDVLADAACAGLGVLASPSFIVAEHLESGALVQILRDYRMPDEGLYAVYPTARHLSRRVRVFVDFLAERFDDTPFWDRAVVDS